MQPFNFEVTKLFCIFYSLQYTHGWKGHAAGHPDVINEHNNSHTKTIVQHINIIKSFLLLKHDRE